MLVWYMSRFIAAYFPLILNLKPGVDTDEYLHCLVMRFGLLKRTNHNSQLPWTVNRHVFRENGTHSHGLAPMRFEIYPAIYLGKYQIASRLKYQCLTDGIRTIQVVLPSISLGIVDESSYCWLPRLSLTDLPSGTDKRLRLPNFPSI